MSKLISRKIPLEEKFLNFPHCVYYNPILIFRQIRLEKKYPIFREKQYHEFFSFFRKILETYRGLPPKMYKFRKTVPTLGEFVEYILDTYDNKGEIDMHWAPVVDFCSVCQVST